MQWWTPVLSYFSPHHPQFVDSISPHCLMRAAVVPGITCRHNNIQHIRKVVFPLCISSYSWYTSHSSLLVRHAYQQESRAGGMAVVRQWILSAQVLLGDVVNSRTWPGPLGDTVVCSKSCNIVNWESQVDLVWSTWDEHSNESGWGLGIDLLDEIKHFQHLWVSLERKPRWDSNDLIGIFKRNVTIHHADKMGCGDYFLQSRRIKLSKMIW